MALNSINASVQNILFKDWAFGYVPEQIFTSLYILRQVKYLFEFEEVCQKDLNFYNVPESTACLDPVSYFDILLLQSTTERIFDFHIVHIFILLQLRYEGVEHSVEVSYVVDFKGQSIDIFEFVRLPVRLSNLVVLQLLSCPTQFLERPLGHCDLAHKSWIDKNSVFDGSTHVVELQSRISHFGFLNVVFKTQFVQQLGEFRSLTKLVSIEISFITLVPVGFPRGQLPVECKVTV